MPTTISTNQALFEFALLMGDNNLISGHRQSEWTGHGPALEQDIAITNIALDLIGQARSWLSLAAEVEGKGQNADDLAYHRSDRQFRNFLLVEQPNGDWANTIIRQFLFDCFHFEMLQALLNSSDERISAIAAKSIKEVSYHLRYNSEWVIRLGDGTAESHRRMQKAIQNLWRYLEELFEDEAVDQLLADKGITVLPSDLKEGVLSRIHAVFQEATLTVPEKSPKYKSQGRIGIHSENLGHVLAEMQSVQRAYPGQEW